MRIGAHSSVVVNRTKIIVNAPVVTSHTIIAPVHSCPYSSLTLLSQLGSRQHCLREQLLACGPTSPTIMSTRAIYKNVPADSAEKTATAPRAPDWLRGKTDPIPTKMPLSVLTQNTRYISSPPGGKIPSWRKSSPVIRRRRICADREQTTLRLPHCRQAVHQVRVRSRRNGCPRK